MAKAVAAAAEAATARDESKAKAAAARDDLMAKAVAARDNFMRTEGSGHRG